MEIAKKLYGGIIRDPIIAEGEWFQYMGESIKTLARDNKGATDKLTSLAMGALCVPATILGALTMPMAVASENLIKIARGKYDENAPKDFKKRFEEMGKQ